jgi:hypothetical protein
MVMQTLKNMGLMAQSTQLIVPRTEDLPSGHVMAKPSKKFLLGT